jgi:hypothetical protein
MVSIQIIITKKCVDIKNFKQKAKSKVSKTWIQYYVLISFANFSFICSKEKIQSIITNFQCIFSIALKYYNRW